MDFWKDAFDKIKLQHELKMYPPRAKMTVLMSSPDHILKLSIKIKGCSSNDQLDTELAFPLVGKITYILYYQGIMTGHTFFDN